MAVTYLQPKFLFLSTGRFGCCISGTQKIHCPLSFMKKSGYAPYQPENFRPSLSHECRKHVTRASADVPDYLPATWADSRQTRAIGPRLDLTAEETVQCQLGALKYNNEPHQDHGVEVMYRVQACILVNLRKNFSFEVFGSCDFAGFDPFERSKYFGTAFDLGQFERFRRIFHHSTYRVLLSHMESKILSSLYVNENCFKQRVWTRGSRPDEEEIFEFTMVQRVGGYWDGYWLTESLHHDGEGVPRGIPY